MYQLSDYSMSQLEAICTSLFHSKDGDKLVEFFNDLKKVNESFGPLENWAPEGIIVAYMYSLYHSNDFDHLFQLLSTRRFHESNYKDLQDIWNDAKCKESELKRGKRLTAVERYRLRQKSTFPKTIWDGEKIVYGFRESTRVALNYFFDKIGKYPTPEQKKVISQRTGLKSLQISNWFKNQRQRSKTGDSAKGSPPSSSSSTTGASDHFNMSPYMFSNYR